VVAWRSLEFKLAHWPGRDAPARTSDQVSQLQHFSSLSFNLCVSVCLRWAACPWSACSVCQSPCCDCSRGLIPHVKLTNYTAFLFLGQPARRCSPLVPSPTRRTSASPRSLQVHADPRVYVTNRRTAPISPSFSRCISLPV
jgi:hypothetical protein